MPGFNEYVGAGVLGGTSALWHLVTAATAAGPAADLYTGAGRDPPGTSAPACGTAQTVGEGRRWRTVGELKEAGLPALRRAHVPPAVPPGRLRGRTVGEGQS